MTFAALTGLVGLIVIVAVVAVVPAPEITILELAATPALVAGLLPVVGTVKLTLSVVAVPILITPELLIKETSIDLPPHPIPVSAFVETLFSPDKVIVDTLKKLLVELQSSDIAVVIPSESQATACLAP
jgi:hypothetical protein